MATVRFNVLARGTVALMKIALHVCCAPCLAGTLPSFAGRGEVLPFFCNPNIHPLLEFRKRLKAVEVFAEREKIEIAADRAYGLERFLELVPPDGAGRCELCYRERLGRTAQYAAEAGADAFSTTMVSSTHQDHDAIRRAGEEAAEEFGVEFIYIDLRNIRSSTERQKFGIRVCSHCFVEKMKT